MKKNFSRVLNYIVMVITAVVLLVGTVPVYAIAGASAGNTMGSLTLTHKYTDDNGNVTLLEGVTSKIYKVAEFDGNTQFTILDEYADYLNMDTIYTAEDQSQMQEYFESLQSYIYSNNVTPTASGLSDSNGVTSYSSLGFGLYLVISETLDLTEYTYTFQSFVVSVPQIRELENGGIGYSGSDVDINVEATPKCERIVKDIPEQYYVYKRWSDSGYESKRPVSITVYIYKDGVEDSIVTLSNDNNWTYSWSTEKGHVWTVSEDTVDGYTSAVSQTGTSFTITNTYNVPETPEVPDDEDEDDEDDEDDDDDEDNDTTTEDSTDESTPGDSTTADSSDSTGGLPDVLGAVRKLVSDGAAVLGARRLPQTGQLWWPLPILVIVGILLIRTGIKLSRSNRSRNKA